MDMCAGNARLHLGYVVVDSYHSNFRFNSPQ